MKRTSAASRAAVSASVIAVTVLALVPAGAERPDAFGRSSIGTSRVGTLMQVEMVPARVSRVAVVPGSDPAEAWALGTSTARVPGWESENPAGQVVFLRYTPSTGWTLAGPPRGRDGRVVNPVLSGFALAANGEGWAVGDLGVLLHKVPGSSVWVQDEQSGAVTDVVLNSVSLATSEGAVVGYAAGFGPTVLRLEGGTWTADAPGAEMVAEATDIAAVAAVSATEAWAVATGEVSGSDSTRLLVYRRSGDGWHRRPSGQAIFDSPPARSDGGGLNHAAYAGTVGADGSGAWVGGAIFPRSATNIEGDPAPGDRTRPFVLRYEASTDRFTSYCPDQYSVRGAGGLVDQTRLCDEPFPTAPFSVTSISIVPGGDVFAGGLGLFRFSGDGWYREPNANGYLISIAMASNSEGWVATPGSSFGAGGTLRSSSATIGHWTRTPRRSAIARWSQPQNKPLEAIALAGDGSGATVAVGQRGAVVIFRDSAWDSINPPTFNNLHGVAWPARGTVWAVGVEGTILRLEGNRLKVTDSPTNAALYGVAFRSADDGVAVGAAGTVLEYSGGAWRVDRRSGSGPDLYAVVTTRDGYLAVGRDGAVLEGVAGRWTVRREARAMLLRPGAPNAPALYAAAALPDGGVLIGGQDSALLVRRADGSVGHFDAPVEGTVLALAVSGRSVVASVSADREKFRGDKPAALRGALLRHTGGRWRDVSLNRRLTLFRDQLDSSMFDDPVYGIAMSSETLGWAAGGSPADLKDVEAHHRTVTTSAVYRVAVGGDPTQPASEARPDLPSKGISFAVFGESWCGRGLCSSTVGTGTMADEVALAIRDEINRASRLPGGPRFVIFTGNMRRSGIPEELEQFQSYLGGFRIPIYAALGSLDRFGGVEGTGLSGSGSSGVASSSSNEYWRRVFADAPAPWGAGPRVSWIKPAGFSAVPAPGEARTHYAFDYVENGEALLRVAVVDSSTRSYGTAADQNPQEEQGGWLKAVLAEAREVLGIPAVVAMNQPTVLPSNTQISNWPTNETDRTDFELTVTAQRVSAIITGGPRINAVDSIPSRRGLVPLYIVGGGGAPLGLENPFEPASKLPTDGYYHAWHLINLDPEERNVLGQAKTTVKSFPVLESVAMHSFSGTEIPAGHTTNITAWARGLNGGFSDPDQAKAAYLQYGDTFLLPCTYQGQGDGLCISKNAILPGFRFWSEQPDIADFVQRNPLGSSNPRREGTQQAIVRDAGGSQGLLCTFKAGTAYVNVEAGFQRSRMAIHVGGGDGQCVDAPVIAPPAPEPVPEPEPPRVLARKEVPRIFVRPGRRVEAVALFPPPPAPAVAPAPPAAPGIGRKEEHEVSHETEGHGQGGLSRYHFSASREASRPDPIDQAWPILGSVVLVAFFAAAVASAVRERKPSAAPARVERERWR